MKTSATITNRIRRQNKALAQMVIDQVDDKDLLQGDQDHIRQNLLDLLLGYHYQGTEDENDTRARILAIAEAK